MYRRESIRPELNPKYQPLCRPEVKVTQHLFGEDLGKLVKDMTEQQKAVAVTKMGTMKFKELRYAPYPGSQAKPTYAGAGGHVIISYIDDTLIIGDSKERVVQAVCDTKEILSRLGFVIHPEKSRFEPSQQLTFLGFDIKSDTMTVRPTERKVTEIREFALKLLRKSIVTIRQLACFIGKVVATLPACEHGKMHYRALERDKICNLRTHRGNYDASVTLTVAAKENLVWWKENIQSAIRHLNRRKPDIELSSDASGSGWGGTDNKAQCGGRWKQSESLANGNNINYLELLAAFFTLKAFCKDKRGIHVLMRIDNTTAVSYINEMGGIKSKECDELAQILWNWCIEHDIWVTAAHLPGVENVIADRRSRHFRDETEWMLNPKLFRELCNSMGTPNIDLFASRLNNQLPIYVSWQPDPGALAINAFTLDWGEFEFYAFPPFCIINRCLQKVVEDKAEGIMIVPKWATQSWFPRLLQLLIEVPIVLPQNEQTLIQPETGRIHPLCKKLFLLACRLSWNPSRQKEFRNRLDLSFWPHGGHQPGSSTSLSSGDGFTFVMDGRQIHCKHMLGRF
ncbi:uncharacterized protein LOC121419534 [Lytechinus variegatus]|uniref:uncharacterized protein LOC121419534 n=1 Tax=Lytechinus variegatus TaxID=7654 RepID=UPI001BB0F41D|nr:uncharacterized protein LOC121419534 [Lytechinus variegatus]